MASAARLKNASGENGAPTLAAPGALMRTIRNS
jgi:hypothetical protein